MTILLRRRRSFSISLVKVFFAAGLACGGVVLSAQAQNDGLDMRFANGMAAIAEDKVITVDDVRREIGPLVENVRRGAKNEQDFNQQLEALQDEVIQNLIDRVLIVKEFYKDEKRRIPASYIDNDISETQINQFDGDRSKFLAYLKSRGKTNREYRKEVEENIIYGYMRQQQRKSQSAVSPVKIETYYNENKERFLQDDEVNLRVIQISRQGRSDEEIVGLAKAARDRVTAGEKFEDVAREVSQEARKSRGGDWGWFKKADIKSEFADPAFSAKKGETTQPVIVPEGAFLLFVEDRKYSGIQPIDEVRDQIERLLIQQSARQSQERWLERLRRNGYIKHF